MADLISLRHGQAVSDRPTIELPITLNGHPAESETTYTWAGPYILSLHTVLPQRGLALELHSTFIGQARIASRDAEG
jgi:hypothetical protein